jgi:murein L,D-transpeptidase YafK
MSPSKFAALALSTLTTFICTPAFSQVTSTIAGTNTAVASAISITTYSNDVEAALVRALEALKDGGLKPAIKELDIALQKNPNFRLGHLMRADLLMAKSGVAVALTGAPGVKQPADDATAFANLRHEAQVRLNRYYDAPAADALPTAVLQLAREHEHVILVDTSRSRIYVFKNIDGKPQRIADFYATIGKRGMEKEREGDQKTPIGVYHITSTVAKEKLTDFYGPGAFPINFPNDVDKRLGRRGSGIWIHGTPPDTYSRPPWASDGCIVLTNDDFIRLSQYVDPGSTPVIISPVVEWQSPAEWAAFNNAFEGYLAQWKSDWESLNMDKYLSHYSQKFDAEGKDFQEWASHKKRVNAAKNFVKVEMSNLSVFEYATQANQAPMMMVTFEQTYKSSNNNSKMKKRQFWQREDGRWKIVFEGATG